MKAAVFKRAGLLEVEDILRPEAKPGELVLGVNYCGICGSDLHRYAHGLMTSGVIMGHEYAGVVAEVGEGVEGWQVGDRVIRGVRAGSLGDRYSARDKGFTLDASMPGGYAEFCAAPATALFRTPDSLSDEVASLSEPLSVGVHAVRRSALRPGDAVALLGAGPIGLLTLQVVRQMMPRLLIVFEPLATRRELALRLGADVVLDPGRVDVVAECVRLTDGLGPDVVFECAGAKQSLQQSLEMVRRGGQVLLLALRMEQTEITPLDWVGREVCMQCSYGSEPADWQVSLHLLASGKVQGEPIISHIVPLAEIQVAFQGLLRLTNEIQVLVRP